MHPDVEKLINIAKEGGELTEKQREIILRKATKLGDDIDEVEMVLETMSVRQNIDRPISSVMSTPAMKIRKCPNCGAKVPEGHLSCPECGFVMDAQSNSSSRVQDYIRQFNERMLSIEDDTSFLSGKNQKKIDLINSFHVPITKEALIQGFTYAKAQFQSANDMNMPTASAWLAKCHQFMDLLKSQSDLDDETKRFIKDNATSIQTKAWMTKGKGCALRIGKWILIFYLVIFIMSMLVLVLI